MSWLASTSKTTRGPRRFAALVLAAAGYFGGAPMPLSSPAAQAAEPATSVESTSIPPLLPPLPVGPQAPPRNLGTSPPFGQKLVWDPAFRPFDRFDLGLVGLSALATAVTSVASPMRHNIGRENGFDESARSTWRFSKVSDRGTATDVSDVLLTTLSSYPLMVDALIVARWYRQSPQVAWQLFLMDMEVLFVTSAIHGTATVLAGRERPYAPTCGTELDPNMRDCLSNNRYRSFFSGHASQSFASAALICTHHAHFPLYGGGVADAVPCVLGMLTAAGTAWLRVASDFHHASDVLTGAAVGLVTGFGLPWLLHYRKRATPSTTAVAPQWIILPAPLGITVGAFF